MTGATTTIARSDCVALDASDKLASLRDLFSLPPNQIYLDGNSLGVLPTATSGRLQAVIADEWGTDLIRSWNSAGWMDLPNRIGDKIGTLIGASPGQVIVADSTSVNLYKVLSSALALQRADATKTTILSDASMFPSDLYVAEGLAKTWNLELQLVPTSDLLAAIGPHTAVVLLTPVSYRTGELLDMHQFTSVAHSAGALMVWDLAHSAGAHVVDLLGCDADFAIGCGYKYLNGGPGAPSFVWAHPRHVNAVSQPLQGWLGHDAPFSFATSYVPAPGIQRYVAGTPPVLSLAALECGVDTVLAASPLGGMPALRRKSLALTRLFIDCIAERCGNAFEVVTPTEDTRRGSQVSLRLTRGTGQNAYAIVQALIAEHNVVGDFRAPDLLRFGFTPLYTRFVDVFDAVYAIASVLETRAYEAQVYQVRAKVT
ncbi:kynureninase [Saprolegnia diclina VS20]|uniref:Kynureninase n=1 Tax=Saprolegnia diclina (strain VS20) TaxID=1156394 RepID=T0PR28_SAPDV|nr:kynureninase [Saprolegnia diclina VS20]EQC27944.1 kynureninase [Saprolegnia diclina VS20]|eukprot:XP_008618557.1 kynureninase [Saprolegnia diclina VS20]